MNTHFNLKASLVVASLLAFSPAFSAPISKADFNAGKSRISADYAAAKVACKDLASNAKDICLEEAKGKEKIARAELQYSYSEKRTDMTKVGETRAKAAYDVAKEKCDDLSGNPKSVCVKEAKAIETKALVDARMAGKISETRKDGAQDKMDADFKVATEKCEALAGDAKTSCVAQARAKFGKT
jgi:hypothetical protein